MADARAIFTQQFDAARVALGKADHDAAEEALRGALDTARSDPRLERELAAALLQLGKLAEKRGQGAEAEQLLCEALEISERLLGMQNPALGPLLSDVGRLHIQQAHYARAGVALERLLAFARAKGEEHPEVATALAGLAMVNRRAGDDTAAEALYRDALRIREKVLDPAHMVTVVTLEQLADTCASRGKTAEALAFLQRALPTREAALGDGHATVTAVRARIAALQEQLNAPPVRNTAGLVFLYKPEPRPRRTSSATSAAAPAAPVAPVAPVSPVAPAAPAAPAARAVVAAPARPAASVVAAPRVSAPVAAPRDLVPAKTRTPARSSSSRALRYTTTGVATVTLAAAFVVGGHQWGDGSRTTIASHAEAPAAPVAPRTTPSASGSTVTPLAVSAGDVRLEGTSVPVPTPASAAQGTRPRGAAEATPDASADEQPDTPPDAPDVHVDMPKITLPAIRQMDVDSMLRASGAARVPRNEALGAGLSPSVPVMTPRAEPKPTDADEPVASRPRIIGRPPLPRFPDALRDTRPEGEVVVRFEVDEHGRAVVSGMRVVRSDDELFTAAVRNILPLYRFEPAHLATPGAKPVAVWVELPFRFSSKR